VLPLNIFPSLVYEYSKILLSALFKDACILSESVDKEKIVNNINSDQFQPLDESRKHGNKKDRLNFTAFTVVQDQAESPALTLNNGGKIILNGCHRSRTFFYRANGLRTATYDAIDSDSSVDSLYNFNTQKFEKLTRRRDLYREVMQKVYNTDPGKWSTFREAKKYIKSKSEETPDLIDPTLNDRCLIAGIVLIKIIEVLNENLEMTIANKKLRHDVDEVEYELSSEEDFCKCHKNMKMITAGEKLIDYAKEVLYEILSEEIFYKSLDELIDKLIEVFSYDETNQLSTSIMVLVGRLQPVLEKNVKQKSRQQPLQQVALFSEQSSSQEIAIEFKVGTDAMYASVRDETKSDEIHNHPSTFSI